MGVELSFVVVNWNARAFLRGCLQSIPAAAGPLEHEVIVVDNASSDGSADLVARDFPRVELIRSEANLGLGKGNNLGLESTTGDFVAFCNPDIVMEPGSAVRLVDLLRGRPRSGMVGPAVLLPDGTTHRGAIFDTGLGRLRSRVRSFFEPASSAKRGEQPVRCFSVHGCCMVFRRTALDAIGGFPSSTYMYGEELLVGAMMDKEGLEVWLDPSARVVHHVGQSVNQRWSRVERNRVRRAGIVESVRVTRSGGYFIFWNVGKTVQALVGSIMAMKRSRRNVSRALLKLHLQVLGGRSPGGLVEDQIDPGSRAPE